ncbi:5-hydroxytryptamine receptor 1A-alpha isoform 1 [Schistosoma japonicum]|uniref:5-hydroxytryptamine receptor 1A-alpha isoform 1 n=1 Tax=Schistosoma japonicum TaxID=6182 RepID=A0A4Z2DQT9_SCHJA|nr:5-hydroxytryptamine receptor 1A-alpha isoform 1 [Schistosoma japonicum]
MNNTKIYSQSTKLMNEHACLWSLKTLHDLPSSYTLKNEPINTNYVIKSIGISSNPSWITWATIIPICIVICTILGNSFICFVTLIDRHLRHRSNVFFISLSVTNIFFSSTVMIFSIMYNLINPKNISDDVVKLFLCLDKLFCTVTILHLVVMAFDRFIHIKAPLKYSHRLKTRCICVTLIGLWLLSFLIAILPIQLNWQNLNSNVCIKKTNKFVTTLYTNQNCTITSYEASQSSSSSSSSSLEIVSSVKFISPSTYKSEKILSCMHKVDAFYAVTNAIFSFIIPLILMVIIYARLFLLTKKHISRLNVCSNYITYHESDEHLNSKQILLSIQSSPKISFKRKSLFNTRNIYINPNYDINNSLRNSLPVTTDIIKMPSRLIKSQIDYSFRPINIASKHGLLSFTNKCMNTHSKMSSISFSSLEQSTRRKHSLPNLNLPINHSFNNCNNVNDITRPQTFINCPEKQIHKAYKAASTLGVILGSFTLCWLPYFTINSIASFCNCISKEAIFVATWLGYFNACLNSLVYSLLNNNFRISCAKLLCAWHYNRERRQQYGLNQLKHFGDTPIQLTFGQIPWNRL